MSNMNGVIRVLASIKLEKAVTGFGYRVIEVAAHGVLDQEMSITQVDNLFLQNGVRVPRRKTKDMYALEVEVYTKGLIVYMYVDEDTYNKETAKLIEQLG
jgi:hypothetical protein